MIMAHRMFTAGRAKLLLHCVSVIQIKFNTRKWQYKNTIWQCIQSALNCACAIILIYNPLHWVLVWYIVHNVTQCFTCSFSIPFPPQKFIQISRKLVTITSFHSFQFHFYSIPITLYICVWTPVTGSTKWKEWLTTSCPATIDNLTGDCTICSPFIRMNYSFWSGMGLYDG